MLPRYAPRSPMREDLRRLASPRLTSRRVASSGLCALPPLAVYSQRIFNILRDPPAPNALHEQNN